MKHTSFWVWCAATGATLAIVAGTATAAFAQNRPVTVTATPSDVLIVRVPYGDLNLASLSGERMLKKRVGNATHVVCRPLDEHQPSPADPYYDCVSFAWNGAKPQIARAIERSRQLAATGVSAIPAMGIVIAAPQ